VEQPTPDKEQKEQTGGPEAKVENETDGLKKALEEAKSKCESNLAGWQRSQADFVNYKRFAEQDKTETLKYANINLLAVILPVIDDFERALDSVPSEESKKAWVEGLKHIDRKFKDTLHKQGVTPIVALGMEFDPYVMEAITCGPGKKDIVIQELQKGYKLFDKVIRPARVIVGSGEEKAKEEE
jgi:molecular chaperone GrpE